MAQRQYREGLVIRYWHPRKGGWYTAAIQKCGRKWATVRTGPHIRKKKDGTRVYSYRNLRVPITDIQPATIGDLAASA